MVSLRILLATFGLFLAAANSNDAQEFWSNRDPNYGNKLQAVVDILWQTFTTDIQNNDNALFFPVPSVVDIVTIYQIGIVLIGDGEMKQVARNILHLVEVNNTNLLVESNLVLSVDGEFQRALADEMKFRTSVYKNSKADIRDGVYDFLTYRIQSDNGAERLLPIYQDVRDRQHKKQLVRRLTEEIGTFLFSRTCGVTFCPIKEIVSSNPHMAMITLVSWNITSVAGFAWKEPIRFSLPSTSPRWVHAAQGFMNYDYAEYEFPENCTCRAIRLPYKSDFSLTFVLPSSESRCGTSENLWNHVQSVNFNELKYKMEFMFVSIPLFKVSAKIDLKVKLNGTLLKEAFDQSLSGLYNSLAFQLTEVSFSPQGLKSFSDPVIHDDVPSFRLDRPFFFTLHHKSSKLPIFAGLIQDPGCTSECYEMDE